MVIYISVLWSKFFHHPIHLKNDKYFKTKPHELLKNVSGNEKIKLIKDLYEGERAFIIGNGPSLNFTDLTQLKDEITFGVNCIFYNFKKMGFKPKFYLVEDKLVAEDRASEINSLTGVTKIFGKELNYCLNDSDDVVWSNVIYDFSEYPGFPHFSKNADDCLWVGGTVSYLCLQLAFYMGFKEVFLIGFDHCYQIPQNANVNGTVITSQSNDPNHFHPDYFGKGKRWHDPRTDRMEHAYRRAYEIFKQDGRAIYNATIGGKLEIFPRVDYEHLFQGNSYKDNSASSNITPHSCTETVYNNDTSCAIPECNGNNRFTHLVLDYTRLCNSRCNYCGIWQIKNGPELSLKAIEGIFHSLSNFGLSTCYVTGGEPYISDKIVDIARLLKKYLPGCSISGATNAVQPEAILKRIDAILNMGIPLEVHVSINGGEKIHDITRGKEGFWKKAVYLIDTLKSSGLKVVASMSLMPQTLKDLPLMQEFC